MNYEDRGNLLQPKPFPGPTLGWRNEAGWQSQFENEGRIQDALSFFATSPNVIYSDSQTFGDHANRRTHDMAGSKTSETLESPLPLPPFAAPKTSTRLLRWSMTSSIL